MWASENRSLGCEIRLWLNHVTKRIFVAVSLWLIDWQGRVPAPGAAANRTPPAKAGQRALARSGGSTALRTGTGEASGTNRDRDSALQRPSIQTEVWSVLKFGEHALRFFLPLVATCLLRPPRTFGVPSSWVDRPSLRFLLLALPLRSA